MASLEKDLDDLTSQLNEDYKDYSLGQLRDIQSIFQGEKRIGWLLEMLNKKIISRRIWLYDFIDQMETEKDIKLVKHEKGFILGIEWVKDFINRIEEEIELRNKIQEIQKEIAKK